MPARIRLQRFGKKGQPFYHIVVADGRAPRDGRFIERLGAYNPMTKPATMNIDVDKAVEWLQNGAQPSDTVRAILSYKGVLYKKHLLGGVAKGALTMEQVETKFAAWVAEKDAKISNAAKSAVEKADDESKARFANEVKINETRKEEIAKRKAAEIEAKVKAAQAKHAPVEEAATEEPTEEVAATEE
jgi:small subunit ribosomal protein S16